MPIIVSALEISHFDLFAQGIYFERPHAFAQCSPDPNQPIP